jgi:hypothetical protein
MCLIQDKSGAMRSGSTTSSCLQIYDPTFDINSYNWIMFGTWEFNQRRRVGYLGEVGLFKRELVSGLTNNDEGDKEEPDGDGQSDEHFDDSGAACYPEHQPSDLNEDEAIQLAIPQSKLAQWDGIAVHRHESVLAQGISVTPPLTTKGEARGLTTAPSVMWDLWSDSTVLATIHPPPPASSVYRLPLLVLDWPWEMTEIVDLTDDDQTPSRFSTLFLDYLMFSDD